MKFQLTPQQQAARQLMTGPQRHTCLVGGARSGKTFLIVRQIMARAIKAAGSRHVILRHRYVAVKTSVWHDTLPKVHAVCFPRLPIKYHCGDGFVELTTNGSQIWFGGLDEKERVDKILGQEYATVYLNECSQIPYSSALVARTRAAQKVAGLTSKVYYDLNPTGKGHWTNRLFGEHIDPQTLQPVPEPSQFRRMFLNPSDNAENLEPNYLAELDALPDRQRRRFFLGQYVEEIDGALWTIEIIDQNRCQLENVPQLVRVVVAVDPSGTSGDEDNRSDAIGIVTAGLGIDGICYVLEDATCQLPPAGWGHRAVEQFDKWQADHIIAEVNYGGEMVRYVIEQADRKVPVRVVSASRGKAVRAEPVSALYDKGLVRHVGRFPELEDQMLSFSTAGYLGERSPDRADALVWAITDLAVGTGTPAFSVPASELMVEPMRRSGVVFGGFAS